MTSYSTLYYVTTKTNNTNQKIMINIKIDHTGYHNNLILYFRGYIPHPSGSFSSSLCSNKYLYLFNRSIPDNGPFIEGNFTDTLILLSTKPIITSSKSSFFLPKIKNQSEKIIY